MNYAIIATVIVILLVFLFWIIGNTHKIPYTTTECRDVRETYQVAKSGCDENPKCICTHERLWGVLGCDECECYRYVEQCDEVTKYRTLFQELGWN